MYVFNCEPISKQKVNFRNLLSLILKLIFWQKHDFPQNLTKVKDIFHLRLLHLGLNPEILVLNKEVKRPTR